MKIKMMVGILFASLLTVATFAKDKPHHWQLGQQVVSVGSQHTYLLNDWRYASLSGDLFDDKVTFHITVVVPDGTVYEIAIAQGRQTRDLDLFAEENGHVVYVPVTFALNPEKPGRGWFRDSKGKEHAVQIDKSEEKWIWTPAEKIKYKIQE